MSSREHAANCIEFTDSRACACEDGCCMSVTGACVCEQCPHTDCPGHDTPD